MSDANAHNHRSDYEAERMLADGPCPLHPFLVWHDRDECVRNWGGTFDPRHSADGEPS